MDEFLSWVRENAAAIDQDMRALKAALDRMGEAGLLGVRVPKEHGGLGWTDRAYREFEESLARASGALAFLQAQHQSACAVIARSPKEEIRATWLPKLARGESKSGIAFAHLRAPGAPMLMAVPKPGERWYEATGDYTLMGTSPWVSGWGIFDTCVTAATRTDAQTIFFVHAFDVKDLEVSHVRRLAAFEVSQTVSLYFRELPLTAADVVLEEGADWIERNDRASVATQAALALGCAATAVDVLRAAGRTMFDDELARTRDEAYAAMAEPANGLAARARAIDFMMRAAQAAVVASGGAGNRLDHPAQRVYREAIGFAVLAQTQAVREATLARITEHGSRRTEECPP